MGLPGNKMSVSYDAAAAAHAREAGTPVTHREVERPQGRAERGIGRHALRGHGYGPGPDRSGEVSRGRELGGVGPHRSSRRRPSPVGMSAHPYAPANLTPSTNATSSGNTNADTNTNANANIPENGGAGLGSEPGPTT
jgi:hypothetical protein